MSLWIQIPVGVFLMAALGAGIWWVYFRPATYRRSHNPESAAGDISVAEYPVATDDADDTVTDTRSSEEVSGMREIEVEYNGLVYIVATDKSAQECREWLQSYAPHALMCGRCGSVIFPRTAVGRDGKEFLHINPCARSLAFFVGYTDDSGVLIPEFSDGATLSEDTLRSGHGRVSSIATRREGADYIHVGLRPVEAVM